MTDPLKPTLTLLMKLGSIAVHVEELFSEKGNVQFDKPAIESLLEDSEVKQWIAEMNKSALLPKKR